MDISDIQEPLTCGPGFLADTLGITQDHVSRLARQGAFRKTGRGQYLVVESLAGYAAACKNSGADDYQEEEGEEVGPLDFEKHRARLYKEKADKAKMENEALRGTLHDGSAVALVMNTMLASFRQRVLAIATKASPLCAELTTAAECYGILFEECCLALGELSQYDARPVVERQRAELMSKPEAAPESADEIAANQGARK